MNTSKNDQETMRRKYPRQLLRRNEAMALCQELGVGKRTFERWCDESPVEGEDFRRKLPGYAEYRYYRETVLRAVFGK